MLLRARWFIMGAVASVSMGAYLANQVRKARLRMTPRNIATSAMRGVARLLDDAANSVQPDPQGRK